METFDIARVFKSNELPGISTVVVEKLISCNVVMVREGSLASNI